MFSGSLRFLKGKPTAFSASLVVSVVAKCQWKHVSAAVRLATPQKWWVSMWEKMAKYIRLGVVLSCPYWLHVILSAWHCLACPYFDLAPHWRLPHDEISCLTPMKGRLVFLHRTTLELKGGLESAWNQLVRRDDGVSSVQWMTQAVGTTTSHWPCIPSTGVARNPNRLSLSRYWNLDLPRPGLFQKHPIWKNIHFGLEMVIFVESQFMSIHVNIMSIQ